MIQVRGFTGTALLLFIVAVGLIVCFVGAAVFGGGLQI